MKKLLLTFAACMLMAAAVYSQDYRTGIGFRGGPSNGLTLKHFISGDRALEGLLAARWGGFNITGLYEYHGNAFNITGLYWYGGFGGHFGSWRSDSNNPWWDDGKNHFAIGADGILGIEYNFSEIPFNLSLDYKPGFNIIGKINLWPDEFALSLRFVLGSR